MTSGAGRRLLSIDVLDAGEHDRLAGWGNRVVLGQPVGRAVSIPVLFAVQVERAPEAVALVCGERSSTYRELDEAANRLAHAFVPPGGRVRASMWRCWLRARPRRSWRSWRCLRSGAAYLPIDPGASRRANRVHDRGCCAGRGGHDGGPAVAAGGVGHRGHCCR